MTIELILGGIGIAIYILGLIVDLNENLKHSYEYHEYSDGGNWLIGSGYTTYKTRIGTTKDFWWATIWPLKIVWVAIKILIGILNDLLAVFFFIFNSFFFM